MLYTNQHQFAADLQQLHAVTSRILSGTGLTASVPDFAVFTDENNYPAKKSKKLLKHEIATALAMQLNRPDFVNYIKL